MVGTAQGIEVTSANQTSANQTSASQTAAGLSPPPESARWLVVGGNGMLATEVLGVLAGRDVRGLDLPDLDITDPASVQAGLREADIVINCAAFTAVDLAEDHEQQAFTVNAVGPANLARQCARQGSRLVQLSTDYVFDGDQSSPYAEDDAPAPRSAYGRTKLAGEWAVRSELPDASYIVRTAWLYGEAGPNFVSTMARLEGEKETVDVVDDQRGQPTWARDVARALISLVDAGAPAGTYHATSTGQATWYALARRVFELLGADPDRVRPTTTEKFPRPARRPANSVLGHSRWAEAGLEPLRSWDAALDDAWAVGGLDPRAKP